MNKIVIFTDLDGSLLDHDSYTHLPADALLLELESQGIPVIPCSSKTRAEIEPLRKELNNHHPFIIENGAAVLIPKNYFQTQPADTTEDKDYWVKSFSEPREHWLEIINTLAGKYSGDFTHFKAMSIAKIMALTGLDEMGARQAADREYGEPVHWSGNEMSYKAFRESLEEQGAHTLSGGRFLHVSGKCDKGKALVWLNRQYASENFQPTSIAIGDSQNDVAMLEEADHALVIRSPVHEPPVLSSKNHQYTSTAFGPEGWTQGVKDILRIIKKQPREINHG